eukprot:4100267-Pyramimonas_sp.AAC.1
MGGISTCGLFSLLRDCVAGVADHSLVGFMAPAQNVSTEVSALSKLRAVDVFKDGGVWRTDSRNLGSHPKCFADSVRRTAVWEDRQGVRRQ